ncbi:MAG: flavodoxin family protein [Treponema sp.]|nr:flavodoxin family protein [Candidatus Treponema caballi]
MKLVIHDLTEKEFKRLFPDVPKNVTVLSREKSVHPCIGCLCCFTRTPGYCILRDDYQQMGEVMSKISEMVIISKNCYGSFSPYVKNVLDRCLPYLLPFFEIRQGKMFQKIRYDNRISIAVHMYSGAIRTMSTEEQTLAQKYTESFCDALKGTCSTIAFYGDAPSMKGVML